MRRPLVSLVAAAGFMILLAIPVLGLHIGQSGVATLPDNLPSKQGYLAVAANFPNQDPYPVEIVAVGGGPAARTDMSKLQAVLAGDTRFGPGQIQTAPDGTTVALTVPIRGDAVSRRDVDAVTDLRQQLIPAAFAGSGAKVYVGGKTAETADYFHAVTTPTPYVLIFVLGLSFVLLLLAFRSLVIAALSIVLNLLSVGAAYGLLTLVFIHGVGASFFGFQKVTAIDAWVPLFLFSVLFALSMDYQVFLMSRIKERYDQTGSTREAVAGGVASTARIITGAALIIIVVFSGFARGQLVMFQQMGFGVAVALLLDATLDPHRHPALCAQPPRPPQLVPARLAELATPPPSGPARDRPDRHRNPRRRPVTHSPVTGFAEFFNAGIADVDESARRTGGRAAISEQAFPTIHEPLTAT